MAKWIERQGRNGDQKVVKARNRIGGYVNGSRDHGWSRHNRDLIAEGVSAQLFKLAVAGVPADVVADDSQDSFCPVTGERKPDGGGVVQFGDSFESWLTIYYGADGRMLSAHA